MSQNIEWDPHTLEEMVKTINPNEEGPVLVRMNNYDGVMVVEIQNGQGGVTQLEGTVVEVEEDLPGTSQQTHILSLSLVPRIWPGKLIDQAIFLSLISR